MKFSAALHRRLHWLNLPGALLIALLQRTPVVRVAATAGDYVLASPVSAVLKAAATTLGALGAVHSMAGATEQLSSSTPNPANVTVGNSVTIVFSVTGQGVAIGSWTIGGNVPPGLTFKALGSSAAGVTTGTINASTIQLGGTPTTAGNFSISLRTSDGNNGTGSYTATFPYQVNVAAAANTAPTIITQPSNVTVSVGGTVVLSGAAAGSPTPTFQWYKGTTLISGATSSALVISGATTADAGSYTLIATNSLGSATSNPATVTVAGGSALPAILAQPTSVTVAAGGAASFVVSASNSPTYQWRKNGIAIPGATNATLDFTALATSATGVYDVVATTAAGSVASAGATLIVTGPLTARLSNLAVRTTLSANQVLTVGFTMSGGGKDVLLRAAGPSLSAFGVEGTMADPKLTLFNDSTQVATNNDWGDTIANTNTVTAANTAVGAFAFQSTTSLDAALVVSVEGGRSVRVSGPSGGNVIVEAYDTLATNTPRLTNLSALNFVGRGGDVLIAGFTVAGTGTKNLLIRAVGPTLGADPFKISGTLADPKLEIFTAAQVPVKIAENDTYASALVPVFASVGAFAFVPGGKDAALIVSLPPGGYTVTVSGADGGTGTAIVEVYELP